MTLDNDIDQADDPGLFDYWRVVWKRRNMILAIFFAGVFAAAVVSFLMTPIYQASATLMPVEPPTNRFSSVMGALQNIPYVGGAVGGALGKTATDKLVGILKSRTVAEEVIQRLDLTRVFFAGEKDDREGRWRKAKSPTIQDTLKVLQEKMVDVRDDRKGLIKITVEHKDANLAAAIANEYTTALHKFLSTHSISLTKRNRIFLEKQLEITKAGLREAEDGLKTYQTRKKLVAMEAQAEGAIKALAEIKALIIAREVQLGAMREYATAAHPEVRRMEDELRELRAQLKTLETGPNKPVLSDSNGALITLNEAPTVGLQYLRLKRDMLVQEKVFELLTQQHELAKIEEAKDEITFQVIDPAIPPQYPIKPNRTLNVIVAGFVSFLLAAVAVFSAEYTKRIRSGLAPPC